METDTTTENDVDINNEGEGNEAETVSVPKKDYDKLNQTLGSLKKELKDLRKPKEEAKETPTSNQKPEESALLQKLERLSLRTAGIEHPEDIELARKTAEKWKVDIDEVLSDEDFKVKLERQQTSRANTLATSGIKGGKGGPTQAKNTAEHWIAKGAYPSREDVPDRATRTKIREGLMKNSATQGKVFYND